MMKTKIFKFRSIVTLVLLMLSVNANATLLNFQNSIVGANVITGFVGAPIQDNMYGPLPATPGFINYSVKNYVKVAINHQYANMVAAPYDYNIELAITYRDNNKVPTTVNQILNVQFDPTPGNPYKDYATYNFTGGHEVQVTIVAVRNAGTGVIVPNPEDNINITYGINIERYKNFVPGAGTTVCPNKVVSDLNGDGEMDQLLITWGAIAEAEEYDLEWTYVDDYANGSLGATTPASSIVFDFKYNSTRITTKELSYKINLIYERGYIIYRVRGVGRKLTNINTYIYGNWSEPLNSGTGLGSLSCGANAYYYNTGHKSMFNWQFSSSFAEEGKKKDVVGYFDGSNRNRQTVTKVNTTDTAIVGESFYDYQGRKAIDALPVPTFSPALTYYANFNKNMAGTKYSRTDFDEDPGSTCSTSAAGMSTSSGASQYYSPNNPSKAYHQSYLPDAENYPFSQVEYTPDNTGRIRKQSGVGPDHQLGSGKETKYYYGRPLQEELDRLFGSEVGYDRHYKKNVVIDPNGQVSISYLDQEGHVIATALTGNTPGNVSAIPSQSTASATLSVDFFNKKSDGSSYLNVPNIDQTSLTFNTQYLVTTPGLTHSFNYNLTPQTYTSECLLANICFDCVYDLELQIKDECGNLVYSNSVRVGSLTLDNSCGGVVYVPSGNAPAAFNIPNMAVGNYQISKVLTVNYDAYEYYLSQYLNAVNNTCFKSYETILSEEQAAMSTINCTEDCSACLASLGTADNFVLTGKGTYEDWLNAYKECMEDCKNPSICEQTFNSMLADLSPGGQYAQWYDSLDINGFNASSFPLSILNYNNQLPDGGLPSSNASASYWKNPKFLKRDGTTIAGYYDEYGITRSKIPVLPLTGGGYYPASSSVFQINGIYYTYPENLMNEKDFVTYWQESWAKSLVIYHPEYCYFKWCAPNTMDTVATASMSSEDFDNNILTTTSYSAATSNSWLNTGNNYAMVDLDPYFNSVPDGIAQKTAMKGQIDNYLGSGLSMKEMAALTIKCPSYYKNISGVSGTCTSFVATGTASIDNKVWEQYKSFYFSAKQKFQRIAADDYAIKTSGSNCGKGYNGCIGVENFIPFNSAYARNLSPNPFETNSSQPCYWSTYMLYKDKVRRFNIGEEIQGADKEKADFNVYYTTGLCPLDLDLSQMLHAVAGKSMLLSIFSMKTEATFTKLIYDKIYANTTGAGSYVDYNWVPTIDAGDNTKLKIEFKNGATVSSCQINLKLPTGYTWSQVKDFGNITVGNYNPASSTTGFTIIAYVDHDANPSTPNVQIKVTGSTCLPLGDCQFYDQCKSSDFGTKLFSLMSALANNNQLHLTGGVNLEASPYSLYLNRFIRNTVLSSGSSALSWKQTGAATGQFEIYDVTSTGSSQNIKVSFNSFSPSFSLSDLYKIKYFTDLSVDPSDVEKGFIIKCKYESSPGVLSDLTITGKVTLGRISNCSSPVPVTCETKEHQAAKDLSALLSSWFSNQPISSGIISNNNSYTELLETYVGLGHHTNLENVVVNTSGFTAALNVYDVSNNLLNSCGIKIYHLDQEYTNNFSDIISVESFWVDHSMQTSNRNYHFKMKVAYSNGDKEIIGGYTTCIPIRSCVCDPEVLEGGGGGSCQDLARLTMDAITKYNTNFWANNPALMQVPQILEADYVCDCGSDYITYLQTYDNTSIKPMTYLEYTVNHCQIYSQACPDYKKYFNTVTDFNKNNPTTPVSILPVSPFPCNCIDAYVDYMVTFKLVPMPNPMPPMDLNAFIANGCKGNGPGVGVPDGCSYPGLALNYYNSAVNAVNDYNSQIPPPTPLLTMPPFNPAIDCNCYLKYAIYLASGKPYSYPNPAKTFAAFQAAGCVDNDCWGEYRDMLSHLENQANLHGNVPPYSPPAYDPSKCNCYAGYAWYVESNYGVNMMSIDEWCALNGGMALMALPGTGGEESQTYQGSEGEGDSTIGDPVTIEIIPLQEPMSSFSVLYPNIKNLAYRATCPRDTFISLVLEAPGDPCETFKNNQAIYNAKKRYEDQILSMTTQFRSAYYTKCLSLTENFTGSVPTKDYHYTLYFYDQAGNLVTTVPPQGVKLIDLATYGSTIKSDRENKAKTVYNDHYLKTQYEYNSLNQLVRQSVPDHDKMDIWSVSNSSNILSTLTVTDVQFVTGNIGFAIANDANGYGYIYKTTDAGLNWNRVDPGSADLKKVFMVNSNDGYALGKDGLFLRTFDGGVNWNLVIMNVTSSPAPISGICTKNLNDIVALDPNTVVVVGDEGTIIKCIWSGSAWTFTNMAGTLLVNSTMNLLSITPDVFGAIPNYARCYVTVNIPSASTNANRIFFNANTFGGSGWTDIAINTKLTAGDLRGVYMIDNNNGYACGVNGGLFKTTNAGVLWSHIATSSTVDFKKIYFKDINNGIVLGTDGNLYSTTNGGTTWTKASAIGTYNDLYFHDKTNGKGFAAGNAGLLSYIDFANISNGKLVKKYITPTILADDFGAVGSASATDVFMGSKTGNIVYKAVITGDKVKYTNIGTISGVTGFKKAVFASATQGAFLTNTGKVYNCLYSGSYSFTNISDPSGNYSDMAQMSGSLYAIHNAANTRLCSVSGSWTGVLTIPGSGSSEVLTALTDIPSSSLLTVGNNAIATVTTGGVFTSNSLKTEPLILKDIYAVPTTGVSSTNTVFACGTDGTLIKSTDAGTTWQTQNSLTAQDLNVLVFPTTTDGLAAGNNGAVVRCTSGTYSLASSGVSTHFNDISYNSSASRYSLVGNNKTFLQTTTGGGSFTKITAPGNGTENFYGVMDYGTTQILAIQGGSILKYNSGTWSATYKLPYALNALHINKNSGLGMIVGNSSGSLYTNNNGNTWILNKPTPKTTTTFYSFTGVAVWNSTNIYTTALSTIPFRFNNLQATSNTAMTGSGITAVNWNDVVIAESGKGYMGGAGNKHAYFTAGATAATIGSNTGTPGTYTVNSISIGAKKAFFVCNSGLMFSADMATNVNTTITTGIASNLLKVSMYDDINGIVLGASGTMLRIWDQNGTLSIDNKTTLNNNGTAVTVNLQAVDYSSRSRVVFGGASGHVKNLETDKQFTSFFWYDQLGRMVVSQNTRQYNKATKAYSYTLYDALGRITEVGEIAQSNSIRDQYVDRKLNNTYFGTWVAGGSRTEVTQTYYDVQFASGAVLTQNNLRKRVASVTYEDAYDANPATYQSATHYSYDIRGNMSKMAQEIKETSLLSTGLNVKYVEYDYDLVSGNVNKVRYNAGSKDQYFHKYEYDGDNRITQVYTGKDEIWWDRDAKYSYYNHGPLARTEIGDLNVQGQDFAYTLHGWIKGVNSSTLQTNRDMGRDGNAGNARQFVAKDAYGYSLGYYIGDYQDIKGYTSIQKFEAQVAGSDLMNNRQDLWNGNISYMVSSMPDVTAYNATRTLVSNVRGGAYRYDQLNRLAEARSFFNINLGTNQWQLSGTLPTPYYENFTYDAMGNISHVNRWGNAAQMDNMDYRYNTNTTSGNLISNRLYHVDDLVPSANYTDDIDDQGTFTNAQDATVNNLNNYGYDELGNLKRDNAEQIASIEWTLYGKIKKVIRTGGSTKPDLEFKYDAMGNRIAKIVRPKPLNVATEKIYYYLRDAQGNEMANYEISKTAAGTVDKLYVVSRPIYGSSRLGVDNRKELLYDNGANLSAANSTNTYRQLSVKSYELSNHLGNVLVTVTDKHIPRSVGGVTVDYFEPEVATISDYYSFGGPMPTRSWNDPNLKYKYGFNGKEKDDDINVSGGNYDFGARIYDSRLGRWLSVDPLMEEYPSMSPYCYAANMPIVATDPDGKAVIINTTTSSYDGKTPTKIGEIAVTKGNYSLSFNSVTNEWDLTVTNHIQYTSAFKVAGANGKTIDQENPGLTQFSKTHEGVHVSRNIKAAKSSISYTTHLLNGGAKTFTGTADKVMTDIFNAYTLQRGTEREDLVKAQVSAINAKYSPLIDAAEGDATKIAELNKQAQSEYDEWAKTTLTDFDKKTDDNIDLLATKIMEKVNDKAKSLNVHEGTNGVNAETSGKLPAGSNAQKMQNGTQPITYQGKTLSN